MGAMNTSVRIGIADDDPLVRSALVMMLDGTDGLSVVAEAADGTEVQGMLDQHLMDVLIMDLRMPRLDGVTATSRVRARPDAPEVLVLTTFETDEEILGALRAGACGYLLKDTPPPRIVEAVRRAADGEPTLSPAILRHLVARAVDNASAADAARNRLATLSERERDVVAAIGRGLTNAQIAAELHVSAATVKSHVSHLLASLGLDNRTQIALLVHDAGQQ